MAKDANYYVKLFRDARDFDTKRFDDYVELAAFYEMESSNLTAYQYEKPWVIDVNVPYASDAIDIRVASLQANDYVGELQPLSPDDVDNIDMLNNAYHNFWNEMQMDDLMNQALVDAAVLRESYIHVVYDDQKQVGGTNRKRMGALEAYTINPASVVIDPKALSLKKARYVCVTERISKDEILERYPDKFNKDETVSDPFSETDRGEKYEGNPNSTQEKVNTKVTIYERKGKKVEKTVLVGNTIVEDTKDFSLSCFPVTQFRWQKKIKSPYGRGLMDRLLPSQKSVNAIESAITNTALQFASPSYAINKNAGVSGKKLASYIGAPGLVIEVNGDPSQMIAPLFKGDIINNDMVEMKKNNEDTIYKMAGATPEFMGDFGSAGNTAGGADQSMRRSKIIEQKVIGNFEEFVQDTSEVIVEFILKVFGGETIYTRGEKQTDGKYQFDKFSVPDIGEGELNYSFYVNLDVKTPYSKEKQKQQILELYQFESQYDTPVKTITSLDVFKAYDLPNQQELIERVKNLTLKDAQTKSELIVNLIGQAEEYGIDVNLIQQAISEIIADTGKGQTPTVDMLVQMIQQAAQQREMAMQAAEQTRQSAVAQAQGNYEMNQIKDQNKPLTGDETISL